MANTLLPMLLIVVVASLTAGLKARHDDTFSGLRGEVAQSKFPPPGQTRDPQWNRQLELPDGRTMVSDGGILLDAAIAKPASLPPTVLPAATGKRYADIMASKYADEFAMSALSSGDRAYTTPSGIGINANYIDYLKRTVSGGIRFRTNKSLDPIVILVSDTPVGVVMPMVLPKK
jgi:hypothetical protein